MSTKHITTIRKRIEWLDTRLEENPTNSYDIAERSALQWALKQIENEERNVYYHRAYQAGQRHILKYFNKTLKQAVHSNNISALQFLLDRTTEWLDKPDLDTEKDL